MMSIVPNLISVALYVLCALGLYTIAKRRGIRHAWLAWVPVASAWVLGSIADDYKARHTGRNHSMRIALTVLEVAMIVLLVLSFASVFVTLGNVLTVNELTDFYVSASGAENDLYAVSQEEMIEQLVERMETRMTDEVVEKLVWGSIVMVALCVLMVGVAIAEMVVECVCLYRLFASCDPQNKVLYLLLGILLGVCSVFVFLCRDKDLGLEPQQPPVGGYFPPPQDPWQGQNQF